VIQGQLKAPPEENDGREKTRGVKGEGGSANSKEEANLDEESVVQLLAFCVIFECEGRSIEKLHGR